VSEAIGADIENRRAAFITAAPDAGVPLRDVQEAAANRRYA
jgi:hypothetical protein